MQTLIEKFEKSIIYILIAIIYAISVFHPDVNVNEGAITELTIIVLAVLAGTGNITDVISWFALRFDFGDVTAALIKEYEKRTHTAFPDFIRDTLIQIADDYDNKLTAQATTTSAPAQPRADINITGASGQDITFTDGQGSGYSSGYGDIAQG